VFAENNIFYSVPVTPGLYAGNWCIAETEGTFYLGANWINQDYLVNRDGYPFDGVMYLQDRLITGDDPGFVDQAHNNFTLAANSPCLGVANPLNRYEIDYPVVESFQYSSPTWWITRSTIANLGATE
jgi:hypothetical protein